MRVVPVLDLMGGQVVRARRGERASYRPIVTPLAADSTPRAVLAGLLDLHPFDTVYLADLDGIVEGRRQAALARALAGEHPGLSFWLDAGAARPADLADLDGAANLRPVIGSECLPDLSALAALLDARPDAILSLDFRAGGFAGPAELPQTPEAWPGEVIVMTLARVGSGAGPDLELLARIRERGGARPIYAAGGVRGAADLAELAAAGAAGVLVASALHDGALTGADLSA